MTDTPPQLTREHLRGMTPEQIVEAKRAGRLDSLLGIPAAETEAIHRAHAGEPLDLEHVRVLARRGEHDLITQAARRGQITR